MPDELYTNRYTAGDALALLPVPIVAEQTVEYPGPNSNESDHVRAPGIDYFERYRIHFEEVECMCAKQVPRDIQPYVYEDRTVWPNSLSPLRPRMSGKCHEDIVPVCYVSAAGG